MGRGAAGVKGINLNKGDLVVGMDTVNEESELLVLTDKGYGKKTKLQEYRNQSRGGKGIKTMKLTERNGKVVAVKVVRKGSELMLMSSEGHVLRIGIQDIPTTGRHTQGVLVMRLTAGDNLVSAASIVSKQDDSSS
jgi:DNA gyrase subunit A